MTAEQQKKFKYWQWRTLFGTIIGYIFFYLVRKNFSFAMPGLTAEYGIDKSTLGAILSAAGFIYGLSKLVNGMLADRVNGRWHMVTGLAVCAISALLFGYGAEIAAMLAGVTPDITPADGEGWAKFISMFVLVLSVLWIINNIFQGCGFPPCSRLIPRWVPSEELATKMSLWNTSHSIGAGIAGVLCGIVIMGYMGSNHSADEAWIERIANNLHKSEVTVESLNKNLVINEQAQEAVEPSDVVTVVEPTTEPSEVAPVAEPVVETAPKIAVQIVEEWYAQKHGNAELMNRAIEASKEKLVVLNDLLAEAKAQNSSEVASLEESIKSEESWKKALEKEVEFSKTLPKFAELVVTKSEHVGAWKWAFLIPGIIAVVGFVIVTWVLRDTPKSVGLPELSEGKTEEAKVETTETQAEISAYIRKHVWQNPIIWALALADFFVYVIRFAVLDWGPTFLQEARGLTPEEAGWTVVIFEVFGVIGMLAAGRISDKVFGGRSTRTCLFCMLGALIAILAFCFLPEETPALLLLFVLAFAGMFIYGPQALIGVIASNYATRKASATANGLVGFVSYVSVLVSGWGFGVIADSQWGWHGVFVTMIVMAIIGMLIFVPMWKMKRDAYEE